VAATGQLSYGQFVAAMHALCGWWGATHAQQPQWGMRSQQLPVVQQEAQYAQMLRAVSVSARTPAAAAAAAAALAAGDSAAAAAGDAAADDDAAAAPPAAADACALPHAGQQQQQQQPQQHAVQLHEYSIVWHESFRVPVLYLRGYLPGEGAPVVAARALGTQHAGSARVHVQCWLKLRLQLAALTNACVHCTTPPCACAHTDGQSLSLQQLLHGLPQLQAHQEERQQQQQHHEASWTFMTATVSMCGGRAFDACCVLLAAHGAADAATGVSVTANLLPAAAAAAVVVVCAACRSTR
jgi:hypothetical protein